jgi:hypothetical protein
MSKKSDPVSSASKAKTNPFTPMRRFFFKLELLKPIIALGKRVRDKSYAADKPEQLLEQKSSRSIDYPLSSSFVATAAARKATLVKDLIQQQHRQGTARIALQQYDQPLDAIVITTLPSYPFCCHEDLLMMSRSQLVQTAVLLNSHLPVCSQIELADGIPDAHIRHSIETLVGIVPDMPGAPKAIKSRRFKRKHISEIDLLGDLEQDTLPSPPTSPLSMRVSRRQEKALPVMSSPPYLLERLEEEDENDFFTMNRPLKKRKVSISMTSILDDEDIDMEWGTPTRTRDLRHSQRMIQALKWQQSSPSPISSPDVFKVDNAFVNMKTRYRSMGKKSTKKRKVASGSQPGSSRKPIKRDVFKRQAITLNYRPFELPTNNSGRYYHMRNKPLSPTSTKSSNSSDEKAVIAGIEDESDNNTSWLRNMKVEYEDNQVAGRIKNLTVGCD